MDTEIQWRRGASVAGERPPLVAGDGRSTRGGATFARPVDAVAGAFGRVADDVVLRVVGPLVGLRGLRIVAHRAGVPGRCARETTGSPSA